MLRSANSYYLSTPSGRIELTNSAEVSMMKNSPVKDSGVYTFVAEKGDVKAKFDIVLCVVKKNNEKRQHQTTDENKLDKCPTFTNKSCCSPEYRLRSIDRKFCAPGNSTSESRNPRGPNIVLIAVITVTSFLTVLISTTAVLCCRKQSSTNRNHTNPSSATFHAGVQAMVISVPAVPNAYQIQEELDPNTFSLRRSQLVQTPSVTDEARSRLHAVTQTAAADTAVTTQAEIHQYSNDDTSGHSADTEEGQHHYASAAPPPLPVGEDEDSSSPGATSPYPLQPRSGQHVRQTDEIESDEEEMPYGMATENPVYEDTNLNQINPTPYYCAVNENQSETTPSVSRNSLYGRQPENSTAAHDSIRTTENLDILYQSCQATDE
ncbi:hypothetical protein Bbelb_103280 [Branchiostoma belcheri]|nr:hypothetical protein Bbelb_103280 [Branchiostoma belcheri]